MLALALLVVSALPPADEVPSFALQKPEYKSGEPIFRFNGKDLDGFYTFLKGSKYEDPKGVFRVEEGVIRVSGEEFGGFATKESFGDYHLVVEWKWGDETFEPRKTASRDSGILLHCVGEDGAVGGQWLESIECQIIEGGTGDILMVAGAGKPAMTFEVREGADGQPYWEKGGQTIRKDSGRVNWWGRDPAWRDVLGYRGPRDVEKPVGEWNRMDVYCVGDRIINVVNGYVVNEGTKSTHTRGKIQFQSEGAEIHFRKIEVRPIAK
jgi:hypothetical protein